MDDVSIADVQGPEERRLRSIQRNRAARDPSQAPTADVASLFAGLEHAEKLYNDGRYAEAERQYQIIREQSTPKTGLRKGLFNRHQFSEDLEQSPIEEDAIFGVAQSQFRQGHLARAEETYAALLKEYPSTRHLDAVSRQLFRIAREWLGFPDANDEEIVQVAYGEKAPTLEQRRARNTGWAPNFTDKTRPSFDVDGRALGALRLIWLHDAAGPLADDALMMAANYHLRNGDHIAAAQHYRLLQEQFPDSPHFKDSLMLGSHVLLASYNGAGYDPSPLEESKQLKLMALQYSELDPEDRARLEEELDKIAEAEIEPLWQEIQFYLAKRQPESVLLHANFLINRFPNSRYARMAAEVRDKVAKQNRIPPTWPYVGQPPPVAEPKPKPQQLPQAYIDARDLTRPDAERADESTPPEQQPRRFFPNFLRRAEEPPALQPVEPEERSPGNSDPPPPLANEPNDEAAGRVRLQSPPAGRY